VGSPLAPGCRRMTGSRVVRSHPGPSLHRWRGIDARWRLTFGGINQLLNPRRRRRRKRTGIYGLGGQSRARHATTCPRNRPHRWCRRDMPTPPPRRTILECLCHRQHLRHASGQGPRRVVATGLCSRYVGDPGPPFGRYWRSAVAGACWRSRRSLTDADCPGRG
jgi:hypothetical protein